MRVKKLLLIFVYWFPLISIAQQPYWQQEVDNVIHVALNDADNTLDGFIKIQYKNNSPDTLRYIWFHLWPNAFKTDRTAFSEQLLQNGRTDFYFSDKKQKGYIDRLDFRVNGAEAKAEDHPLYIDVIKVILPNSLLPGRDVEITTPFHIKLPYNFSGCGYIGKSYQITQWYPKPAVYDSKGWHEMPYLQQGGYYGEFGSFDVRITVPKNYIVAAPGALQSREEDQWATERNSKLSEYRQMPQLKKSNSFTDHKQQAVASKQPATGNGTRALQFKQNNICDFAWFADKDFIAAHDTLLLNSGKVIDVNVFYLPATNFLWKKSIQFIKEAIRFRSSLIGEYPYNIITVVEGENSMADNMKYPCIISIPSKLSEKNLEAIIDDEIGYNWFYAALANNEREYPWMNIGMNSYYNNKFNGNYHSAAGNFVVGPKQKWAQKKMPDDIANTALRTIEAIKRGQPIETASEDFTSFNYKLIGYQKSAEWIGLLEKFIGTGRFDNCMKAYYERWQFKHPYPEDFKKTVDEISGLNTDSIFLLLHQPGALEKEPAHKKIKPAFLFNLEDTKKYNYISLIPAVGYNLYDKFMIGAVIHNYTLPPNTFQFAIVPLYAVGSKQLNGIGKMSYAWHPDNHFYKIILGLNGARFSTLAGVDSNGINIFGGFYKIAPSITFILKNRNARSTVEKWIGFKSYIIGERGFDYFLKKTDSTYYPEKQGYSTRWLNQLTYDVENYRALYPYHLQFQVQQASQWYRLNFITNYFFNYSKGGGMNVRFFAAKFGYFGGKTLNKTFSTYNYQPKLTASIGSDDYTYSNYFLGRNEFENFASQQIMMRDGGLKLRTDLFQNLQGRSDNWVAALNFNSTLPTSIVPKQIPLKVFFDAGTYAEAWGNNPPTSKFLYVGGLQLSLLKNIINIYAPIMYSSDFRNQLKTLGPGNAFLKKISFSIDVQNINLRRIYRNAPF